MAIGTLATSLEFSCPSLVYGEFTQGSYLYDVVDTLPVSLKVVSTTGKGPTTISQLKQIRNCTLYVNPNRWNNGVTTEGQGALVNPVSVPFTAQSDCIVFDIAGALAQKYQPNCTGRTDMMTLGFVLTFVYSGTTYYIGPVSARFINPDVRDVSNSKLQLVSNPDTFAGDDETFACTLTSATSLRDFINNPQSVSLRVMSGDKNVLISSSQCAVTSTEIKFNITSEMIDDSILYDDGSGFYTIPVYVEPLGQNANTDYVASMLLRTGMTVPKVPTLDINDLTVTYSGKSVKDSEIRASASYEGAQVNGTFKFKDGQALTNVSDSGVKTVVFTPDDSETYSPVEGSMTLTINKATPTGAPKFTDITTDGKSLADANITTENASFNIPGTVTWELDPSTEVQKRTQYKWIFTPEDTDNYNILEGWHELYHVVQGGGGGMTTPTIPGVPTTPGESTTPEEIEGSEEGGDLEGDAPGNGSQGVYQFTTPGITGISVDHFDINSEYPIGNIQIPESDEPTSEWTGALGFDVEVPVGEHHATFTGTIGGESFEVEGIITVKESNTNKEETEMPDNNPILSTDPVVNFTEKQVQALVTSIFNSVNARIAERIVQSMTAGDSKHVASADAVKAAIDGVAADLGLKVAANESQILDLTTKVGDGTEAAKTYTDEQVNELRTAVMGMNHWDIVPVTGELPEELAEKTIYLQRDSEEDTTWEMNILTSQGVANIGRTEIDLSNYWTKDNIDGIVTALFGSELFGTKMGELLQTTLTAYTEETLDGRYWKKDAISELVTELKTKLTFTNGFFRLDNRQSFYAFFQAISSDRAPDGTTLNLNLNGGLMDYAVPAMQELGIFRWNDLRNAAGLPYREDDVVVENTKENIIRAIKAIAATTDLSETYLAIEKLKEVLGIEVEGPLTAELVEEAILRIVQSNEVEAVPITDEKINEIVSAAFADSAPDLSSGCQHTNVTFRDNGDGTHSTVCDDCNAVIGESEVHSDDNVDGFCDKCGASMRVELDNNAGLV